MQDLKRAKDLICVLNRSQTKRVIEFLSKYDNVQVNQIYGSLGMEQSIASHALSSLRHHNLVSVRRQGKFCLYTLDRSKLERIYQKCSEIIAE